MRVSDSSRVLFVHVQKTGGSTLDRMFDDEVPDARRVGDLARHAPYSRILAVEPELEDYWSFGFVRNPWARMVSWFTMIQGVFAKHDRGVPKTVRKFEKWPGVWGAFEPYRHSFDAFVLEGTDALAKVGRAQVDMLRTADGREVDFIGRTENFIPDLNVARAKLGLDPLDEIKRVNATSKGHYSDYYNDATRAKVAEVYAKDIEEFGYTYEDRT